MNVNLRTLRRNVYIEGTSHADWLSEVQALAASSGCPKYVVLRDGVEVAISKNGVEFLGVINRKRRRQLDRAGFRLADASWDDIQNVLSFRVPA